MSDTLNSLLQHSATTTALQGVMNPEVLNPLAAQNSAIQAAGNMYDLRAKQATAGWGDALQQATDPKTGVVDLPRAQAIAAGMGLRTQQGMMTNLTGASNLATQQIDQNEARRIRFARNQMSLVYDWSDANINKIYADEIAAGTPEAVAAQQRDMWLRMPEDQRRHAAYAQGLRAMDVGTQAGRVMGDTKPTAVGGEVVAPTVTQPTPEGPGTLRTGPGSQPISVSPDKLLDKAWSRNATAEDVEAARKNGITIAPGSEIIFTNADVAGTGKYSFLLTPAQRAALQNPQPGNPTNTRSGQPPGPTNQPVPSRPANAKPAQLKVPGAPAAAAAPVANPFGGLNATPPAAPPAGAPNPFGGLGAPPAAAAPAVPVVPAPAPVVPPARPLPSLGGLAPDGSVQVASANPLDAPVTGPPSPPSPLVPGDVNAIMQGMDAARNGPRLPGTQTAQIYTQSPGYDEQVVAAQSKKRLEQGLQAGADYAKSIFPVAQALKQYSKGITTAQGAEAANQLKSWTGGVLRSLGGPRIFDSTADFDKLAKDLNQILMSNSAAGRSDAALNTMIAAGANTHVHEWAGEDVTKANAAIIRANAVAASQWQAMTPDEKSKYSHYFANYENDFNKTYDLRAGAYDLLNTTQKKALVDNLRAHPEQQKRFWDSVDLLERNGYLNDTRAMP
jgi:hypothetical protein